jgi:hypothetical protein
LPLITSKPRFTHPAVMPSAGVVKGRWHITVFIGFWDLGLKMKYGRLMLSKWERVAKNAPFHSWQLQSRFWCYRTQKLPFSKPFSCLRNWTRFTWDVSTIGCGLLAWLDSAWCC